MFIKTQKNDIKKMSKTEFVKKMTNFIETTNTDLLFDYPANFWSEMWDFAQNNDGIVCGISGIATCYGLLDNNHDFFTAKSQDDCYVMLSSRLSVDGVRSLTAITSYGQIVNSSLYQ